ncbi:HNH endonuclease [Solwaraspora sp. WMMD791]|uniref:HNH endonuclease n=1 Tax=Solwaraspora sp. WMMD791 TaxID=3016086 RepID=UPI00249B9BCB|nr:HNH endonuclease [Solwaraspora sp. WMMD791]WFE27639.1 HNH endonuclease [Solwaraspora sp. WMMD791]WFE27652.1 HNH endonuclease [Solwaraspora sp. WMMD791]
MQKKQRWFDEGALVLRSVLERLGRGSDLPAATDYYACPCCLVAYTREALETGELTEEHVPPRVLGGRGLVLTCKDCNNSSGTYFDSHAHRRADTEGFLRGRVTGRYLPATMYADGIPLRGTAHRTGEGIQVFGVPSQNDPKVQAAHFEAMDAYVDSRDPNPRISFTIHGRYSEARARYSWIRSAYLAAFAALGWSYVLRPVMKPITDQLRNPTAEVLPTYMFRDLSAPPELRRILLVDDPDELRCVAVAMGEFVVFLPGLFRPLTWPQLADAFGERRNIDNQLTVILNGKEMSWPHSPTYFLDRSPTVKE